MRKILIALAALAAACSTPAWAQLVISRSQSGAVGNLVTATDPSGNTGRVVLQSVTLSDPTGASTLSPSVAPAASGTTASGNPTPAGCDYNATPPTLTTGQRGTVQCGTRGYLGVQMMLADSATPVGTLNGSLADGNTNIQAALRTMGFPLIFNGTTWDRVRGDVNGTVTQPWAMSTSRWTYAAAASGIVNTTTAVTIKAAAGASVKNYLTSCQIDHDTLSAVTELVFRDGAAGTVIARAKLQTTAVEGRSLIFAGPLAGTANTLMEVATLTAVTGGVYVNCQGFTGS